MHLRRHVRTLALATVLVLPAAVHAQPAPPPAELAPPPTEVAPPPPEQVAPPSLPEPVVAPPPPPSEPVDAPTKPLVAAELGKGVTFTSPDEAFSLTIRGRAQLRGTMLVDPDDGDDSDQPTTEFVARRVRLLLQGHFFAKTWQYYVQLGFSNQDTEPDLRSPLRDAYLTYTKIRDLQVRVGQMKVPLGRQRVVSSSALQFPDRSIVVGELNLDRDVGIQVFSKDLFGLGDTLGYQLGLFGGDGRNRQSDTYGNLYVARLEVTPLGKFEDSYSEGDVKREDRPRLAVAVGAGYNQHTNRPRSTFGTPYEGARFDYLHLEADAMFKWRGLSLLAEVMLREADEDVRTTTIDGAPVEEASRSGWGWFVQAGQMITAHAEVGARYSDLHPLDGTDPALGRAREAAVSASYYFQEHAFKLQADQAYLFGEDADDGRYQTRVQIQLYF